MAFVNQRSKWSSALAAANPGLSNLVKGAFGLPFGLSMVILTGAELFTGNVFVMLSGLLSKKVTQAQVMKNWLVSYAELCRVGVFSVHGVHGDDVGGESSTSNCNCDDESDDVAVHGGVRERRVV